MKLAFTIMLILSESVTLSYSSPKGLKLFHFVLFPPQQNEVNAKLEFLFKGLSFKIMNSYKLIPYLEENGVEKNNQK